MPFELINQTATLASVTPRTEKHGDEDVPAVSLKLCITDSNMLMNKLSAGLTELFYREVDKPEGQQEIEGTEVTYLPKLRMSGIDRVALRGELNGWTLTFDFGIDESSNIVLGGANVDKFTIEELHEGGTATWSFRVGTSDVSEESFGRLCMLKSHEVTITLTAPAVAAGTIDGSVDAFKRDHPDSVDPTDLFLDQHGDGAADDEDADEEVES